VLLHIDVVHLKSTLIFGRKQLSKPLTLICMKVVTFHTRHSSAKSIVVTGHSPLICVFVWLSVWWWIPTLVHITLGNVWGTTSCTHWNNFQICALVCFIDMSRYIYVYTAKAKREILVSAHICSIGWFNICDY